MRRGTIMLVVLSALLPARPATATTAVTFSGTLRVLCERYVTAEPFLLTDPPMRYYDCTGRNGAYTAELDGEVTLDGDRGRLWSTMQFSCAWQGAFFFATGAASYETATARGSTYLIVNTLPPGAPPLVHVHGGTVTGFGASTFGPALTPLDAPGQLCVRPDLSRVYYEGTVELVAEVSFAGTLTI